MSAFQIPGLKWSLPSGAAIPRFRFIAINDKGEAIIGANTAPIVGASQNETAKGETQEIISGIVMIEAAGTIVPGTTVGANAEGKAVSGSGAGTAITGGETGNLVSVLI